MKIVPQSATLLAMTPDPLFLLERCGRVCYKSEEKLECPVCGGAHHVIVGSVVIGRTQVCHDCLDRATKFVQGIIKRGHESVLEHASATFLLVTDRGMTHELVRHRIAAYSQESTRFCNYGSGEVNVVLPSIFSKWLPPSPEQIQDALKELAQGRLPKSFGEALTHTIGEEPDDLTKSYAAWYQSCQVAEYAYGQMINNGMQPQWARAVLPTCLKTEIAVTMNFRQWRHVLRLRLCGAAGKPHPQMVELMKLVHAELMKRAAAPIFADIVEA